LIIKNLNTISIKELSECFNLAFSDYVIPIHASEEYLTDRFNAAGINYNLSFGAFDNKDRLVAFIMHCEDEIDQKKAVFNIATGVIPEYRGQRIVSKLYNHAAPILRENNINFRMLEVIQSNEKAIKAYHAVGFEKVRELYTYQGEINIKPQLKHAEIKIVSPNEVNWGNVQEFWNYQPSWENSTNSILRKVDDYKVYTIQENNKIYAYAVVHASDGIIRQFGVNKEKRRNGLGLALFHRIGKEHKKTTIFNVDKRDKMTMNFLEGIGLKMTIKQYEMQKVD